MKFFKQQKGQFISQVTVLAMIFGFAAGVVGQIFADVYINPWEQDYLIPSSNSNNIAPVIPELRRVKRFLGIEQDFKVNETIAKLSPNLVGIYAKKSAPTDVLNQVYLPAELKVNAFILTSDGWLVSYGEIFNNLKPEKLVAVYNQNIFPIDQVVKDSVTGVFFLKIAANNLPVVILGDSDEINLGQLTLTLNYLGDIIVTNIKNSKYLPIKTGQDFVISSEKYQTSVLLADNLDDSYIGSPLVNLGGEVIGVIKENDLEKGITTVLPINQFSPIIIDILKNNLIKRPSLGINYLDLAYSIGLDKSTTQGYNRGALIYQKPKTDTPAALANLQINDIILSVDSQLIDKDNSLTELIQQYQPGDTLTLEVSRKGKVINVDVTLDFLVE